MSRAHISRARLAVILAIFIAWHGSSPAHASCGGQNPPIITTLTPSTGLSQGGTVVTITGTSLGCVTTTLGGALASNVVAPTSTTVIVTTPPGSVGPVTLTVQNPNVGVYANATASTSFTYYTTPAAPAILSVTASETQASLAFTAPSNDGGATITDYEYTLDGGTNWIAAGTTASPFVITGLTGTTNYTVALRALNPAGPGTSSAAVAFTTLPPPPAISSISPGSGPSAGGTSVVITGANFTGATSVSFGATSAASFTVDSATQITTVTPTVAADAADVSVTTAGGTATLPAAFTFVSDVTRPGVTLTGPAGPVTAPFTLTTTFSEVVTGFDASDITIVNATLSNFSEVTAGTVFTVLVTPLSGETVTAEVAANLVQDAAGNFNTASNSYAVAADTVAPTVELTGPAGPVTAPFTLTTTFSEAVTGFDASDITIVNATLSNFSEVTAGTVFTVLVTPVMGQTVTSSISAGVVTDAAGNPNDASERYSVQSGSVKAVFDSYRDDIKRIIQDQAEKRLTTLMNDNGRMMQDARTRFVGFVGGASGQQAGLMSNGFEAIAFDVDGTLDVSGDMTGVVAASSGEFLGQTGMVNGANWRLSGNFDVLIDDDETMTAVDGRVAREQFLRENILWGAFGGGQFSNAGINDSFQGSETTWQLYLGTYAVGKLTDSLFADGYASVGYGWSDLSMQNNELSLDSTYGTVTWQVGGSLAGLIEMQRFSLLPTISVAYGNSNLGEIDFTAQAYGLSDNVSLDADYVAMGVLRLTPEMRFPLGRGSTATEGVVLGLLPSFICEQIVADDSETRCGWGAGVELTQRGESGPGQFNGRIDFEQIGGISRIGGQLGYSVQY